VYLKDPVRVYEPARTLHSENALLVVQPKVRTKTYGERRMRTDLCDVLTFFCSCNESCGSVFYSF
jgi:hypothetical protein